jgi:hypothetical protein
MSWRRRLRIIWAAMRQDWHLESCADCGEVYWMEGSIRHPRCLACPLCEMKTMDEFFTALEQKGAA